MQNKNFFTRFLESRTPGYCVLLGVAFYAFLESLIYVGCYSDGALARYFSAAAFVLPLVAVIVSLALSTFRWTAKWAPVVLYGLELCAFGLFIESTYMYLASQFFGGISLDTILGLAPGFLLCTVLYLEILIGGVVAIFLKQPEEDLLSAIGRARKGTPVTMKTAELEG